MRSIRLATLCIALSSMLSSCSIEWYEPKVSYQEEFQNLTIPSVGEQYEVPFEFLFTVTTPTKLSVPEMSKAIRCQMLINDVPSEVFDATSKESPINWYWHPAFEVQNGALKAFFRVSVPKNEASEPRTVSAQISIDNYWTEGYRIDEEDAHDWGEWMTILSGIQEGR